MLVSSVAGFNFGQPNVRQSLRTLSQSMQRRERLKQQKEFFQYRYSGQQNQVRSSRQQSHPMQTRLQNLK